MKILLRSNPVVLTCLALTAGSSHADGFLDDSKASLNLRNFYLNRNFVNGNYPQAKAEEWTQSFILDARSGYTEGLVGFGVDVLGLYSVKLDGGKGTACNTPCCRCWRWPRSISPCTPV